MVIDFHTHTFADRLCPAAVKNLEKSANVTALTDGSFAATTAFLRSEGVDVFVANNIATSAHSQKKVNDYAVEINGRQLNGVKCVAFGSVYPFAEDAEAELDRLKSAGIKGIKFHNEYQNFFIDDERAVCVYEYAARLGFVITFHGGADPAFAPPVKATPAAMRRVYDRLNYDKFVFAHLGGYGMYEEGIAAFSGTKINIDISLATDHQTPESLEKIIRAYPIAQVLFASDCPWNSPKLIADMLEKTSLSYGEKQYIYHLNAERLLAL